MTILRSPVVRILLAVVVVALVVLYWDVVRDLWYWIAGIAGLAAFSKFRPAGKDPEMDAANRRADDAEKKRVAALAEADAAGTRAAAAPEKVKGMTTREVADGL